MFKSFLIVFLIMSLMLMSGCMGNNAPANNRFDPDKSYYLKVLVWGDTSSFSYFYKEAIAAQYPNVDLEVTNMENPYQLAGDPTENLLNTISEVQPDIIVLDSIQYPKLANADILVKLDNLIKTNKFDLKGIHPGVLNQLTNLGEGNLYGLSPTFLTQALFYNRTLFDQAGIPYPTDQMSWEEVLALGQKFAGMKTETGDTIYGFHFPGSELTFIESVLHTNGLQTYDENTDIISIHSPSIRKVWELGLSAYESGTINPTDIGKDLFAAGQAAMTVNSFPYLFFRASPSLSSQWADRLGYRNSTC